MAAFSHLDMKQVIFRWCGERSATFPKDQGQTPSVNIDSHYCLCLVFTTYRYITLLFKHRWFSVYPPTECIHLGPRQLIVVMFGSQPSCQGCLIHTESWTSRRCRRIMWISTYGSWNWSNQVSLQHQKKMPNLPCEISIWYPACFQSNTKRIASQQKNKKKKWNFCFKCLQDCSKEFVTFSQFRDPASKPSPACVPQTRRKKSLLHCDWRNKKAPVFSMAASCGRGWDFPRLFFCDDDQVKTWSSWDYISQEPCWIGWDI